MPTKRSARAGSIEGYKAEIEDRSDVEGGDVDCVDVALIVTD